MTDIDDLESRLESFWKQLQEIIGEQEIDPCESYALTVDNRRPSRLAWVSLTTGNDVRIGMTKHKIGQPWMSITPWEEIKFSERDISLREAVELGAKL